MDMVKELHTTLRSEAARACRMSRQYKGAGELDTWYHGRYLAYKQSAALLQIALGLPDDWRKARGHEAWRNRFNNWESRNDS